MYVVRRAFRNYGQVMLPGSIIEPSNIKRFNTRLKERYIVEVTPQTFDAWNQYFVGKLGVSIDVPKEEDHEESKVDNHEAEQPAKAVPVRVVVKANK